MLSPDLRALCYGGRDNKAIADAQTYFESRVVDLEGVCHEAEFSYWKNRG
jgi:hypothetical protein